MQYSKFFLVLNKQKKTFTHQRIKPPNDQKMLDQHLPKLRVSSPTVDGDLNFFYDKKIENKLLISFDRKKNKKNFNKS